MDRIQESLNKKYSNIHPLLFKRSLERSKSNGELFDFLYLIPKEYPIVWSEKDRCWVNTLNLLQGKLTENGIGLT